MMPASNMKILTLAAAAETLGWDYRYTTTLETTGTIEDGVLQGDLVVRGTGDPTINSRSDRAAHVLDEWIGALAAAGIRRIDGRIIGNDQAFDDEGLGAGWAWDYLQYGYAAPVGALQYNEDVAALVVTPGATVGAPAAIRLENGSGLVVLNRGWTAAAGTETTIDYRRHLEQPLLEITGAIALGASAVTRTVAVVNPTLFFVQSLKDALAARGIDVTGPAVDFDDVAAEFAAPTPTHDSPRVLATTSSPPLRDIAVVLMKVSQNLYAETLLKTMGAARGGLGTIAAGQRVLRDQLKAWMVPDDCVRRRRRLRTVPLQLRDRRDADHGARADVSRPSPPRRLPGDPACRGQGRDRLNAHAPDPRRRERPCEDWLHLECPLAFGLRPHP